MFDECLHNKMIGSNNLNPRLTWACFSILWNNAGKGRFSSADLTLF